TEFVPLPRALCHHAKLNQAIFNLIANALDACEPGGRVQVRTAAGADAVEVHVTDNGRGIDPAIREKVFDPFFTTKPPGHGLGLGLTTAYAVAQDHGGRIAFERAEPRGTRFTLTIPLRPPAR